MTAQRSYHSLAGWSEASSESDLGQRPDQLPVLWRETSYEPFVRCNDRASFFESKGSIESIEIPKPPFSSQGDRRPSQMNPIE